MPPANNPQDEMEARLDVVAVRLRLRGPARWVFATVLIVVVAIFVLRLTGH
jgi:hypothetical protein